MVASDPGIAAALARERPIGEGDIKLIALESRIHELKAVHPRFKDFTLCLTSTVDTDSFPIMLLDAAKRRVNPYSSGLHSLFCMREPASKREREESGGTAKATWLVCDTVLLEYKLQCHLWSQVVENRPSDEMMLQAMLALCASTALCGCDFTGKTGQKGSRFDHFWEALPEFIATEPKALACFGSTLADDSAVARTATGGLLRVCYAASGHMEGKRCSGTSTRTYKTQAKELWDTPDRLLRRSIWATAYWAQHEFIADSEWGFSADLSAEAVARG